MEFKTKTYHTVDYNELERKIEEVYGNRYEIAPGEEVGNNVTLNAGGTKTELDDYEIEDIQRFRDTGKGQYLMQTLVLDMINNDIIPEGDWLVEVSW